MATTTATPPLLSIFVKVLVLSSFLILLFNCRCHAENLGERKTYVVYLDYSVKSSKALALELLGKVLEGGKPEDSLTYTYNIAINGFAAILSESEAQKLGRLEFVIKVALEGQYELDPVRKFAHGNN